MYKVRYLFGTLIPIVEKERKRLSVTFAICVHTVWYDREAVKFQDSGSEIKISTAKRHFFQLCRSVA